MRGVECLWILFLLLLIGYARGDNIYVSSISGIDSAGCGLSEQSQCKTLQYIFGDSYTLPENCTVYIGAGTYDIQNIVITSLNITLTAWNGQVILTKNGDGNQGMKIHSGNVVFTGLIFRDINEVDNLIELLAPQVNLAIIGCLFRDIRNIQYNLVLFNQSEAWKESTVVIENVKVQRVSVGVHLFQISAASVSITSLSYENTVTSSHLSILFSSTLYLEEVSAYGVTSFANLMNIYGLDIVGQQIQMKSIEIRSSQFKNFLSLNLLTGSEIVLEDIKFDDIQLLSNTSTMIFFNDTSGSFSLTSLQVNGMRENGFNLRPLIECYSHSASFNSLIFNSSPQYLMRFGSMETLSINSLFISNVNNITRPNDPLIVSNMLKIFDCHSVTLTNITFINNYPIVQSNLFFIHGDILTISSFISKKSYAEGLLQFYPLQIGKIENSFFETGSSSFDITFLVGFNASLEVTNNIFFGDLSFYCSNSGSSVILSNNTFAEPCPSFLSYECKITNEDCQVEPPVDEDESDNGLNINWWVISLIIIGFILLIGAIAILIGIFLFMKFYRPKYNSIDDDY